MKPRFYSCWRCRYHGPGFLTTLGPQCPECLAWLRRDRAAVLAGGELHAALLIVLALFVLAALAWFAGLR